MKKLFFAVCFSAAIFFAGAQQYTLLVGTYTQGKSYGIYLYDFQPTSINVTLLDSVKSSNPSFLAVDPDEHFVYAANEDDNGKGTVSAFSFDKNRRKLTFINKEPSGGDSPCYVTTDKTGKWVITGNYNSGTLSVFPVAPDGGLGMSAVTLQHEGSGPDSSRQKSPHVHATVVSPDNKYVFVPDLGIDQVIEYNLNTKTGNLTSKAAAKLTPGAGPRHLEFHPSGKWMYVIQELKGLITAFSYNKGEMKPIQSISLLPDGFTGVASSADIHISPDGKFLYASDRRPNNSITIFSIDQNSGQLTLLNRQSTLGDTPRNFNFDPTGNFLFVANQNSNNIVIFSVDKKTGMLTDTGKQIFVPNPVCIKWIVNNSKKK